MNIRKGDIVQSKLKPNIQGQVMGFVFLPHRQEHYVRLRRFTHLKWVRWKASLLRVVRRGGWR